jgi:hypothetical protein
MPRLRCEERIMDESELRAKRLAVREQIQVRLQKQFEERKREIKARIKKEDIPPTEKRRKYRREVHEEKLALMKEAKIEFRARKRMLGLRRNAVVEESPSEPPPIPAEYLKQAEKKRESSTTPPEDEFAIDHSPGIRPEEAFIYDDRTDSDAHEYGRPIDASDMLPFGEVDVDAEAAPAKEISFEEVGKPLIHYIFNIIIHPVQTLDEFDDYLTAPGGLLKVVLFYLASFLPVVFFTFFGEEIASRLPHGLFWSIIGASMSNQNGFGATLFSQIGGLLLFTSIIAVVNYFFADDANFLTLLVYFSFVDAVTQIIVYTLVATAAFASVVSVIAPVVVGMIVLLFVVFFFWRLCLNVIVLMNAYGYDWYIAIILAYGAYRVQSVVLMLIFAQVMRARGF